MKKIILIIGIYILFLLVGCTSEEYCETECQYNMSPEMCMFCEETDYENEISNDNKNETFKRQKK